MQLLLLNKIRKVTDPNNLCAVFFIKMRKVTNLNITKSAKNIKF